MIVGIDIGTTITKAVAVENRQVLKKVKTRAIDAITSATGAFGKMLLENDIKMPEIEKIITTGVGSSQIKGDLFGIPTTKIDEISAVGIGGMFLAGRDNIIITNIGTGTLIVQATKDKISHLGGSGVGGGTILGLSKRLISLSGFNDIMAAAEHGHLNQVDLLLEDIVDADISFLSKEATAANFGKMLDTAKPEDIALAILNLVYQVVGILSVFAARGQNIARVLVTGSGSDNPVGKRIFTDITTLYQIGFDFPPDAEYTTAIGAGLSG